MNERKATMDELLIELLGTANLVGSIDDVTMYGGYIRLEGRTDDGRGYYLSLNIKEKEEKEDA